MKNLRKVTFNLLKIAIALLTVSGCSENSSSLSESSEITPVSRIMVTPPSYVIVGKTYNLEDYVDVVGGPGSDIFNVTVRTTTTAEVTGHTLRVLAEGTITLDISADAQKSRFSTTAMAQLMAEYKDYTSNIEYEYSMIGHVYETGALTHENYIHNEHYVLRESQDSIGIVPVNKYEGLIEYRDGDVYQFEADGSLTSETLNVNGAVLAGAGWFHYFYVSMAFPASYEYFKYTVDQNGIECLVLDASTPCTIEQYSNYFGGTMIGELYFLMYYGMCINTESFSWDKCIIYKNTMGDGFYFYWSIKQKGTNNYYYISYDYLSKSESDTSRDVLDNFISNGAKPEMPSISEATTFFSNYVAASNYTVSINWYGYNFTTGKHTTDYETSTLYVNKDNAIYLSYELNNGEETPETGISGFVKREGDKVYSFETNSGLVTYSEITDTPWDSIVAVATSSYLKIDSLSGATVSYRDVDSDTGDIEVDFSKALDFSSSLTVLLGNYGAKLTSRTDLTEDWWDAVEIDVTTTSDLSKANATIQYAMYADADQTEYLYCDIEISNLNSTTIPQNAQAIYGTI